MPKLAILVGPPGSGKSTLSKEMESEGYLRVSQDDQGRPEYLSVFRDAVDAKKDIVVDRMNFTKPQRKDFMILAPGYDTEIIVLHQPYKVCLERMIKREGHPTIKDVGSAKSALHMFFSKYERVEDDEANAVTRVWPDGEKPLAIVCDLDGTLCNVEHRRHFVRPVEPVGELKVEQDGSVEVKPFKKNWMAFYEGIKDDTLNKWCRDILTSFSLACPIVLCSGRGQEYENQTVEWLMRHDIEFDELFMRQRKDSRKDSIVKEIILDFEILTRYEPHFFIDDRSQVVEMWRKRGYVCLQCDEGNF